jgi:hypothetical protein
MHLTYQESAKQFHGSRQFLRGRLQILNVIEGKGRKYKIKRGGVKRKVQTVGEHEPVMDAGSSPSNTEHSGREIDSNHRVGTSSGKPGEPSSSAASQVKDIASC